MKTLTIIDLARSEDLGRAAMTTVRGGYKIAAPSYSLCKLPPPQAPSGDSSIHVDQNLLQYQDVLNATANGSGFVGGVHAANTTSQFGQNNVLVYR